MSASNQPQEADSAPEPQSNLGLSQSKTAPAPVKATPLNRDKKVEQAAKKSSSGPIIVGSLVVLVLGLVVSNLLQSSTENVSKSLTPRKSRVLNDFEERWKDTFTLEYKNDALHLMIINKESFATTPLIEVLEGFTNNSVPSLKGLRNLTVDYPVISSLNTDGIFELGYFITRFPDLEGLSLTFKSSQQIPYEAWIEVFERIRLNIKNLQYLNLDFKESSFIMNNNALINMSHALGASFTKLKALSFDFAATDVGDAGFKVFIQTVAEKLTQLVHLDLGFRWANVGDQSLEAIARAASEHLKTLRHFKLDFTQCAQVSDTGFSSLVMNVCYNLVNLEALHLLFGGVKLTNIAVQALTTDLDQQKNLKELHLDFSKNTNGITDPGIEMLLEKLKDPMFSGLTHFTLKLQESNKITEKTLKLLTNVLSQKLTKLEYLALDFNQAAESSVETLKNFATLVGRNLKNLKYLFLDFIGHENFNDEVLIILGSSLANARNLEHLTLNLMAKKGLTDKGLTTFYDGIGERFTELRSLSADLYEYPKLGDSVIISVSNAIKKLHKLNNLNFVLAGSERVSDTSLEALGKAFRESPHLQNNLENLQLDFSGCRGISNNAAIKLLSDIGRNLRQLKMIRISFLFVGSINNDFVSAISTEILQNLNVLQDIRFSLLGNLMTVKAYKDLIDEISKHRFNLAKFDFFIGNELTGDKTENIMDHFYKKLSFIPSISLY